MIGISPGRSASTACQDKYQLVTRSDGTGTALWRDQERSETIPFGIAAFRIGVYALWPFGYTTVERRDAGAPSCIGNVLWLILAGWWLALAHIATGIALCLTIIGIPFGIANFKLIPVSLLPLGREIVRTDEPFAPR
ncbi:YccF domain-containing protein [Streptomyces sp. CA-106131]|uniref:YccF domain-containing protein n=1 Tax=Streptomyces sp. CA-106131 TaxID=3240045 RepID=UPI003D8A3BBB